MDRCRKRLLLAVLWIFALLLSYCCTVSSSSIALTAFQQDVGVVRRLDEETGSSSSPVLLPTSFPTALSTAAGTSTVSDTTSSAPTSPPTMSITDSPTLSPTILTTYEITELPTESPTVVPTAVDPATYSPSTENSITTLPTVVPTAVDPITYSPSTDNSITTSPVVLPTIEPSPAPTAEPSAFPSTQQPSSRPTMASKSPSFLPSMLPIATPSSLPSAVPSLHPTPRKITTAWPSSTPTILPTSSPSTSPSTTPSASPTSTPSTGKPSSIPSASPTGFPSGYPTSFPTSKPSSNPTSIPTVRPSYMPTPRGIAGDNWWFLITAKVDVIGYQDWRDFNDERDQVTEGLDYAFAFVLTDSLGAGDREKVTVIAKYEGKRDEVVQGWVGRKTMKRLFNRYLGVMAKQAIPNNIRRKTDEGNQTNLIIEYSVKAWCPSRLLASHVVNTMRSLVGDAEKILEPLRERDLRSIQSLTIYQVDMTATTSPPDSFDPNLSPVRIFYIILGTIAFFIIAVFVMKNIQYVYKRRDSISREFRYQIVPLCRECGQGIYEVFSNMYGEIKAWMAPSLRRTYRSVIRDYDELDFQRSIHYKERKYDYLDDEERSMMDRSPGTSSHGGDSRDNSVHGNSFKDMLKTTVINNIYSPIGKTLSLGRGEEDEEVEIELTTSVLHHADDDDDHEDD